MLELRQNLKLTQELRMTPQLQQAIKLLQLSRIELQDLVQQELVENPMLEEFSDGDEGHSEAAPNVEPEPLEPVRPPMVEEERPVPIHEDEFDYELILDKYDEFRAPQTPVMNNEEMNSFENRAGADESLGEHLAWQARMASLNFEEHLVATELIGNIDSNGYLKEDGLETVCNSTGVTPEYAERVLKVIQTFDPLGAGARDLKECLMIQAQHFFPENQLLLEVINNHLNELVGRSASVLARKLNLTNNQLKEILDIIATFNPKPGREFYSTPAEYVVPDVFVTRVGEQWVISLNENGLPKLRVSDYYRNVLHEEKNQDTQDFLKQKVRSAVWLVRSIYQRQETMKKVSEAIFRFQEEFLENGPRYLRPLILRDVAEEVGMHESTISRVTTNKYAQTPQGIFELKYFFGARIESQRGEDFSAEAIRERIRDMVAAEDPSNPLSDQAIVEIMAKENIKIARRTVAKYRQQLGLLSSNERMKAL